MNINKLKIGDKIKIPFNNVANLHFHIKPNQVVYVVATPKTSEESNAKYYVRYEVEPNEIYVTVDNIDNRKCHCGHEDSYIVALRLTTEDLEKSKAKLVK